MAPNLTPLFIRLPKQQAVALDRLSAHSGRPKQHVVSELVAQALGTPPRQLSMGRVEVTSAAETHADAVLTLDEVAAMLKLGPDIVRSRAEGGDLPGRRFSNEWRFSKLAILTWLADGDSPGNRRRR